MLRHWGFTVFLLTVPIPVQSRPSNALSYRQRRSVGHAQMMHDRGRSLHDRNRRMFIQDLLEQVNTAQVWDSLGKSEGRVQTPLWPKLMGSTKKLPLELSNGHYRDERRPAAGDQQDPEIPGAATESWDQEEEEDEFGKMERPG